MQKIYDYISVISQFTKELTSSQCFNFIHGKKHPAIQRAVEARTYKHYLVPTISYCASSSNPSSDKSNSLGQGQIN